MKRYEGLFILDAALPEDGLKEIIDKITAEITNLGGKVETTQKMDKRPFVRVADKKHGSGYYVNVIFQVEPSVLAPLRNRFTMNENVFRILFTVASESALPVTATTSTK